MRSALHLLLLAGSAAAVPHEAVHAPQGYTKGPAASADVPLEFTFALKHSEESLAWLRETVATVSDPDSAEYGRHVTLAQLREKMAAPKAHVARVTASLQAAGFHSMSVHDSGDFIAARADAAAAGAYFNATFCSWTQDGTPAAQPIVRACEQMYHLPSDVAPLVDFVSGLVHFPATSTLKVTAPMSEVHRESDSLRSNSLKDLRATYGLDGVAPTGKSNVSVAFTQFIGQFYSPKDLQTFEKVFAPAQAGQVLAKKVGPTQPGEGVEANLDAQFLLGTSAGLDVWVWSNQHKNPVNNQEAWVEFLTNVANNATVPDVVSMSYGEGWDTLTGAYMNRSDVELQKLAARGVTVAASSGDNGAGCNAKTEEFVANFPASLPHILAVGGTANCKAGSGAAFFSSGGFSSTHARPAWQDAAVKAFLGAAKDLPPANVFNSAGRAYPDVAACGTVIIVSRGHFGPVSGTSCSCPIFSGVLGLLNDRRVAAGKSKLGFVAPALYKAYAQDSSVFSDITSGSTIGCGSAHWTAAPGWDPTTGLGTPNFAKLSEALLAF